jgi:hypothetical protein
MSRKPFTTSEDFSKAKQDFDRIPTIHISYASSYLALLQCNMVEHPIVDIWEDLDTLRFLQHGEYLPQVTSSHRDRIQQRSKRYSWRDNTSSDAYHKVTGCFLHHMNSLVSFRRYTRSLDTLELNVLIIFSLLITIGEVCMFKFETSLLGVNNVIEWELLSLLDSSRFSTPYSGHVLSLVMWFSWRVTTEF